MSETIRNCIDTHITNVTKREATLANCLGLSTIPAVIHLFKGLIGLMGSLSLACSYGVATGYYKARNMEEKCSDSSNKAEKSLLLAKKSISLCVIGVIEAIPLAGNIASMAIQSKSIALYFDNTLGKVNKKDNTLDKVNKKPGFIIENYYELMKELYNAEIVKQRSKNFSGLLEDSNARMVYLKRLERNLL
ncbi:MAG: hypothetical protein QRY74_04435 [Chlamydia sp.]